MEVFHTDSEIKNSVRKYFNVTEESIKRDVNILKDWLSKQEHLPQDQDDEFLENVLLRNKFRIEQAKLKIDAYYSLKNHYKQYFENVPIQSISREYSQVIILPKLTPKLERIILIRSRCPGADEYDCIRVLQTAFIVSETKIRHDYSIGDQIIFDSTHYTFDHFKKLTPTSVRDFQNIYQKAYSGRIIGMHLINSPVFVSVIMNLMKQVLKPKLFSRAIIHDNLDSLHKHIPKESLPDEYGGTAGKIDEVLNVWDKYLTNNNQEIERYLQKSSNEKLRVGKLPYSDLIGMEGTFKKLNID